MASTTALFTGLGGLNVNSRQLEVIGNNISNVNTTAYKSNRMLFSSAFNRTLSLGTGPTANSGGRNPGQVGLGVTMAGTQRNFNNGAIAPTGINTDLAIEGEGFFIVERNQERFFTRAGSFQLNSNNDLVTISGDRVQGFEIDDEFNIIDGQLEDLNIPLGTLTIAEATSNVRFNGNLNADGEVATAGSLNRFAALTTGGGAAAAAGTLLTALDGPLFAVDDVITLSGGERGQKVAPDASFTVTATTTLADFGDFMMQAMGIVPSGGADAADPTFPGPEPGGFAVNGSGQMELTGNWGELNDIDLEASDFTVVDSAGVAKTNPFIPTKVSDATGESVRTTFIVYDSLGTELQIDMTMVLGYRDGNGTHWRSFLHSGDDTDLALHLEAGDRGATVPPFASELTPMVSFDNFGQISSIPQVNIELDRTNTGALDPMQIALQFEQEADAVSALSDSGGNSVIAAVYQDGSPLGTLSSFSVGEDGIITGGFTNGLTQTIGQVAVAKFTNDEGLVDAGNNLFRMGPNSGTALVTEPLNFGTGRVIGGALEQANVDLSSEFTNMILTSTGYSASSRVINTTNELIQQLLVLGR